MDEDKPTDILEESPQPKPEAPAGAIHQPPATTVAPTPAPVSHWASLSSPEEIRRALKDLIGLVAANKILPAQAREVRANLTDQLRFALARDRQAAKPKRGAQPGNTNAKAFQDLEATEALAIEIAHREIAYLGTKDKLTSSETRRLEVCFRLVAESKRMAMREFEMTRRLGRADPDRAKEIAKAVVPSNLTGDDGK